MNLRTILAISALASASIVAHADLIGSQVDVQYQFPGTSTVDYDSGTQTVVPGLTDVDSVNGVSIGFGADTITITNLLEGGFGSSSFNGVDVSFLSGPAIENVTYDPSSSAFFATGSVLNFTASNISLNLSDLCDGGQDCPVGDKIVLDVTTATPSATPEPSSIVLLGTGLLGAVGVLKKRLA